MIRVPEYSEFKVDAQLGRYNWLCCASLEQMTDLRELDQLTDTEIVYVKSRICCATPGPGPLQVPGQPPGTPPATPTYPSDCVRLAVTLLCSETGKAMLNQVVQTLEANIELDTFTGSAARLLAGSIRLFVTACTANPAILPGLTTQMCRHAKALSAALKPATPPADILTRIKLAGIYALIGPLLTALDTCC